MIWKRGLPSVKLAKLVALLQTAYRCQSCCPQLHPQRTSQLHFLCNNFTLPFHPYPPPLFTLGVSPSIVSGGKKMLPDKRFRVGRMPEWLRCHLGATCSKVKVKRALNPTSPTQSQALSQTVCKSWWGVGGRRVLITSRHFSFPLCPPWNETWPPFQFYRVILSRLLELVDLHEVRGSLPVGGSQAPALHQLASSLVFSASSRFPLNPPPSRSALCGSAR